MIAMHYAILMQDPTYITNHAIEISKIAPFVLVHDLIHLLRGHVKLCDAFTAKLQKKKDNALELIEEVDTTMAAALTSSGGAEAQSAQYR